MYPVFRSLLFRLEAERAHNLTLNLLRWVGRIPSLTGLMEWTFQRHAENLQVSTMGLQFPNPLGLAAGYDKDGIALKGLASLGFGHLEIGTVTPKPQAGNPKPRVFRLVQDEALINRLGFPNRGLEQLQTRLQREKPEQVILGLNLGKGVDTPLEEAVGDYQLLLEGLYPFGDYFTINVSSPNTLGLRRLQAREHLKGLLTAMTRLRDDQIDAGYGRKPLLVKLSPDLTKRELLDSVGAAVDAGVDGLVIANTTVDRPPLRSMARYQEGGLSGLPLQGRTTKMIRQVRREVGARVTLIGVGGIKDGGSAREKLDAGADLIQIYTGLVYRGPGIIPSILRSIEEGQQG